MTYYLSMLDGEIRVFPHAFAIDELGDVVRLLAERGETTMHFDEIPKSQIIGIESTISDHSRVAVVDPESPCFGQWGAVAGFDEFVQVALDDGTIRPFAADQLAVWSGNRVGRPGYPSFLEPTELE